MFYNDDDMFWGHVIEIDVDSSGEIICAHIAGWESKSENERDAKSKKNQIYMWCLFDNKYSFSFGIAKKEEIWENV